MTKYIILDTEETRDFCYNLVGTICYKIGEEINNTTNTLFYKMQTLDGELLFLPEELKEVY